VVITIITTIVIIINMFNIVYAYAITFTLVFYLYIKLTNRTRDSFVQIQWRR